MRVSGIILIIVLCLFPQYSFAQSIKERLRNAQMEEEQTRQEAQVKKENPLDKSNQNHPFDEQEFKKEVRETFKMMRDANIENLKKKKPGCKEMTWQSYQEQQNKLMDIRKEKESQLWRQSTLEGSDLGAKVFEIRATIRNIKGEDSLSKKETILNDTDIKRISLLEKQIVVLEDQINKSEKKYADLRDKLYTDEVNLERSACITDEIK